MSRCKGTDDAEGLYLSISMFISISGSWLKPSFSIYSKKRIPWCFAFFLENGLVGPFVAVFWAVSFFLAIYCIVMAFTYIESRFWVRKWSCLTAAFRKKGSPAAAPQFMFGLLLSLFLIKYREEERKCSLPCMCSEKSGKIESFEVLIHHLRVTQIMKAFVQHQPTSNLFWKIGKGDII